MKICFKNYIYRYMTLKESWVDKMIKCPFTNVMVNTTFINPNLYPFYIKRGFGFMFNEEEVVTEKETKTKKK